MRLGYPKSIVLIHLNGATMMGFTFRYPRAIIARSFISLGRLGGDRGEDLGFALLAVLLRYYPSVSPQPT